MNKYFETMEQLCENAGDVTRFPSVAIAEQVFIGVLVTYFDAEGNPMPLHSYVTPEMVEAATATVFGRDMMSILGRVLPKVWAVVQKMTPDEVRAFRFSSHRPLALTAWGETRLEHEEEVAFLLVAILQTQENIDRFVANATKRLAALTVTSATTH